MFAKVALLFAAVAAAHASVLLNSGILAPGLAAPLLSSPVATRSVIATPGAITTDSRVIGATGLIAGAPLAYRNGLIAGAPLAYSNGLIAGAPLAYSNGLIGAAPLAWNNGIVSPLGLRAGVLAAPGLAKTVLLK